MLKLETVKKLINEYDEKVKRNKIVCEKNKNRTEDMIITYNINKDLIFRMFFSVDSNMKFDNRNLIYEIEKENSILFERIYELFKERREADKKLIKITKEIDKRKIGDDQRIKNVNSKLTLLKKKISEKEAFIEKLKKDIEKIVSLKEVKFRKNIFVTYPMKSNIETYLELLYTKEIIFKLRKNIDNDKIINQKLKIDLRHLQNDFEGIKKSNGILIESPFERENYDLELINPFKDEEYINTESIDISRYYNSMKENDFLLDEDNFDEIFFPDRVYMKKIEDPYLVKRLNLNFTQDTNKNLNHLKIIEQKNNIKEYEMKLKEQIINDKNLTNKTEEQLLKTVNDSKLKLIKADEKIVELSQKINNYTNTNKVLKTKIKKLNENIKFADYKINLLKGYISEFVGDILTDEESSDLDDEDLPDSESLNYSDNS